MINSDNIEEAVRSYCDNQKSTARTIAQMDEKVIRNAIAAYKNTNPAVTRLLPWRNIMKSNYAKLTAAAVIIVGITIGAGVFNVSLDGANIAWAEMVETMKAQQWIHAVGEYEDQDRSGTSQMWVSVNPLIMVMKVDGNEIAYYDSERNISHTYNYEENTVTIDSVVGTPPEGLGRLSPVEFVEMIIQDMQRGQDEITSSIETRDGKEVEIISGNGHGKTSIIVKDVESGLILSASTSSTEEPSMSYRFEFDYPKDGPADIFDLGVPEDAQFIDNRPTGDLKELTKILSQKCMEGFGDFQAVKLVSTVEKDGTLKPSMVYLTQEKDKLKRYDQYSAFDTAGLETKQQTIYEDIKNAWPDLGIEAVLAIDNDSAIVDQRLFDGKNTINCCWVHNPLRVERRTIPVDAFHMLSEWAPAMVWRSPGQIMACPDNINKAMEEPGIDREHMGLVGLRVRTTVKKTRWTFKTIFPPRAGIRDFWFDPTKDYILVEEVAIYEDSSAKDNRPKPAFYANYSRTVVLESSKTDKGQLYPSVIQTYSGDSADDPEMRIEQQNIVIDTSPVFEPGTFATETMLQDE